jgi:predicted transcriptional regulator
VNLPVVSDAELAILQLLWDRGQLTTRQLTEQLYPKQTGSDLATVQKLVQRLENKQLVRRDRSAFVHAIVALIDRNDFAAQRLAATAAKLARGSLKPLLAHLVESDQLSPEELEDIRKLLEKRRKKRH